MLRRVVVALALVALGSYAWLAVQIYRAHTDPEHFQAWSGPHAWILGPTAKSLNRVAAAKIDAGIAALNDTARPSSWRLATHRNNLREAEQLLARSLRAQPAQARTLARLAAIRFELDPPLDEEGVRRFLRTIETASTMALCGARQSDFASH